MYLELPGNLVTEATSVDKLKLVREWDLIDNSYEMKLLPVQVPTTLSRPPTNVIRPSVCW